MRKEIVKASDLPDEWDCLAKDNPYLKREFLCFLERTENAGQTYQLFYSNGVLDSVLVAFEKERYNLFMFTEKTIAIKIRMFYFPLSVSRPAFTIGEATKVEVADYIKRIKGYKILLNADEALDLKGFARGLTCPRCVLNVTYGSFKDYIKRLRSNYRYRFLKALKKSEPLTVEVLQNNGAFSPTHYALYEAVYNRSRTKLEKLSVDFFRDPRFKIITLNSPDNKCVGFVQLLPNGEQLIFEFVGFDHELNQRYDIYLRLLLEIVKAAIEGGYKSVDFGQTADDAKLKLGCTYTYLYAFLHHSNPLIHFFCRKLAKKIQYKPLDEKKFHVFNA